MGLSIKTGLLADLKVNDPEGASWLATEFERINVLLEKNGLPKHQEPHKIGKQTSRSRCNSFPYGYLHYLRRALAFARQDASAFTPVPDEWEPSDDPILENELFVLMNAHLICHSDCEGYYVPVDFEEPLFSVADDEQISGAILGSSTRLLQELIQVAPLLEIQLDSGQLSDAEAQVLADDVSQRHPFSIERLVWFALYEAARISLAQGTAIVFQ